MRFLLCSTVFDNNKELIQHYVSYDRVYANNRFFQKLFQRTNNMQILRKCLRCDDFTRDYKSKHNFLKYLVKDKMICMKISHLTSLNCCLCKI